MKHHNILTPKGERYVAEHSNVIVAFRLRDPLFSVPGITAHDVRHAVEAEVDRLISLLDAFDGDDETEADADFESSLGGAWFHGEADLEADDCDQEDSDAGEDSDPAGGDHSDYEPSLGSPEIGPCTSYWISTGDKLTSFGGSQELWANGQGDIEEEGVNEDGDDADFAA